MKSEFSRESLVELLRAYSPSEERRDVLERIVSFVESTSSCAERSHVTGHLTGSAWIVNHARSKVLLLHHRKLNRWMQVGGHADGDLDLLRVALKEAYEESGLTNIEPVSHGVFDVDIHEIPPFNDTPAHYHYDVRFLLQADDSEIPKNNHESNRVEWVSVVDIRNYTHEESVLRMTRLVSA